MRSENSYFYGIDRLTVLIYLLLVVMGWLNVYAAVYDEKHAVIFDISQKYGKQLIWILGAFILAIIILIIDAGFFTSFAYPIYALLLIANILVVFIGKEIKGSRSWFRVGDIGVQPAEFIKFAIGLALAKFLSNQVLHDAKSVKGILKSFWVQRNTWFAMLFFVVPLLAIKILQNETGLALVLTAFIIVLYREGLNVNYILFGFFIIVIFIFSLSYSPIIITLSLIGLFLFFLLFIQRNFKNLTRWVLALGFSIMLVFGSNEMYNRLLPHQRTRMDVLLGRGSVNLKKEGYNVNQAKIAIGSGGLFGKGYLQGTQTKYHFVPEQETDFIFCTVGEEWGFLGSIIVIALHFTLIIRIITLAERQRSDYSRIYGYAVASILFFHVTVNIGMALGLLPVIGIPLPFFSYGGSSIWAFTVLLFIFIKLDASRLLILR